MAVFPPPFFLIMGNFDFFKGSLNPRLLFSNLKYKLWFARNNPDYFYPSGIWVFTGPQGSGKTLSAVKCLCEIKKAYPLALVVSNIDLNVPFDYLDFTDYSQLGSIDNDIQGVIFFLDELHVLWNSLESKDIPISEMASFCQMRKARRVIIGTSQVYGRIAKPIREQLQLVVLCKNYFDVLQHNAVCDPMDTEEVNGKIHPVVKRNFWFFHSVGDYRNYDTLRKVERVKRLKGGASKWLI